MNCPTCGAPLGPNDKFCTSCGTPFKAQPADQTQYSSAQPQYNSAPPQYGAAQPQYGASPYSAPQAQPPYSPPVQVVAPAAPTPEIPYQYRPLSAWAYFGYSILFCIPLVGFILLIVFSFSDENINRRNYARSYFCWLLIAIVIAVVLLLLGVSVFSYISDLF